jgi:GNAT superfamily N-acetyltransferase
VQALVVDAAERGRGIGGEMLAYAEKWARERGFWSVAVPSQVARTDSHAFYEGLGYRVEATSHLVRKMLA